MPDTNKVKFGLSMMAYAVATANNDGTYDYATPVMFPGAKNLSLEKQGELTKYWFDDVAYYVTDSDQGFDGELEVAKVIDSFNTDILGHWDDDSGVTYDNTRASSQHFALLYQTKGDAHARRHVIYDCVAGTPSINAATIEDGENEPQTETLPITASSVYDTVHQKYISKGSCSPTASAWGTWYDAVHCPWLTTPGDTTPGETPG